MIDDDLDTKIERLFGLITEELRTLRELLTVRIGALRERVDDHDQRISALERKQP